MTYNTSNTTTHNNGRFSCPSVSQDLPTTTKSKTKQNKTKQNKTKRITTQKQKRQEQERKQKQKQKRKRKQKHKQNEPNEKKNFYLSARNHTRANKVNMITENTSKHIVNTSNTTTHNNERFPLPLSQDLPNNLSATTTKK